MGSGTTTVSCRHMVPTDLYEGEVQSTLEMASMNAPAAPSEETDGALDPIDLRMAYCHARCIKSTSTDWFHIAEARAHTERLTASHARSAWFTVSRARVDPPPMRPKTRDAASLKDAIVVSFGMAADVP